MDGLKNRMRAHAAPTAALSRVLQLYNGGARSAHSRLVIGTAALQRRHTQRPQPPCQGHCSSTTAAHAAPTAALSRVLQLYNGGTRSAAPTSSAWAAGIPLARACPQTPGPGPADTRSRARRYPIPGPQIFGPSPYAAQLEGLRLVRLGRRHPGGSSRPARARRR